MSTRRTRWLPIAAVCLTLPGATIGLSGCSKNAETTAKDTVSTVTADSAIPRLVGVWEGRNTGGYLAGDQTQTNGQANPTAATSLTQIWTLTISTQEGSGLQGTWGASGSNKNETIVGAIRADGETILFSDEDTMHTAKLISETKMELCSQEAGIAAPAVRTGGPEYSIVAVCKILDKK